MSKLISVDTHFYDSKWIEYKEEIFARDDKKYENCIENNDNLLENMQIKE